MSAAAVIPISTPTTLVEIVDHLSALLDTADMVESPDQKKQIEAEIAAFMEAEVRKVDNIAGYLARCEAEQVIAAEEIKRLQKRKQQWEAREDRVKQYVIRVMDANQKKKLEGRGNTLSIRNSPPSVQILDEAQIPAAFKVVKTETAIDKKAIGAALKANQDVPGADLIYGRSLRRD